MTLAVGNNEQPAPQDITIRMIQYGLIENYTAYDTIRLQADERPT